MKNWLKKCIPTQQSIKKSRELKSLTSYLKADSLWAYDCQSVARGVAAGLAGAVVPGFQLFYAAILVILFRGNLPIALLATLVTNPLTAIPIMYFIYFIGTLVIKENKTDLVFQKFNWDFSSFHAFWSNVSAWILQFGKAFFIGLPIVSICLAIIGYFGTILIWKISAFLFQKKNRKKYTSR